MAPDGLSADPLEATGTRIAGPDHVVILLALYNGAARLRDQLDSLADQTHDNWSLVVSDDGSTDGGAEVLRRFAADHPRRAITLVPGPRMGFAQNFLHLLRAADPEAAYVSFCDQDDVWMADKTARAVAALKGGDPEVPALYCGRTLHCDEALRPLRPSPLFTRPPSFRNALVQNIGGGNTIVLNRGAFRMLAAASTRVEGVVSHDWWMYQLVSGSGGTVIYDREPGLLYRQHGGNAVGANGTARTAAQRFLRVMQGRFRDWNDQNIAALTATEDLLTPENREVLDIFRRARRAPLAERVSLLRSLGVHRQTARDNLALWLAVATRRI